LVDNDGDGWPEYVPVTPSTGTPTAPYVYFDAVSYSASVNQANLKHMGYPRLTDANTSSVASDLATSWGVAAPMAQYFDPSGANPTRWARDTSFQIICPGLDGQFAIPPASLSAGMRIPIFPAGQVYESSSGYSTQGYYTNPELDNLTNLSGRNLEQARNEAQQ